MHFLDVKTLVLKFGGAAFSKAEDFSSVANLIIDHLRNKHLRVVVVVSAMANMTDQLLNLAKKVSPNPPKREQDMLVSIGERMSMALLAMALQAQGVSAVSLTGSQSGIITSCDHANAKILDVKPRRILDELAKGSVVIVAGFQGVSIQKEITTLGRGGSDTTAVALGVALEAEKVVFYKDVLGIYPKDPKQDETQKPLAQLNYRMALDIVQQGAKVLHPRCLQLAERNVLPLLVTSFKKDESVGFQGTHICDHSRGRPMVKLFEEGSL